MSRRVAQPLALPGLEAELAPKKWRGAVRAPKSKRATRPAPQPWECVILAVDTARRSGWALLQSGRLLRSGEVDTTEAGEIESVIALTLSQAQYARGDARNPMSPVLVLEKPWGGNVNVVAALGRAAERWLKVWDERARGHLGKVVRVSPAEWRPAVLGPEFAGATREQCRAEELEIARRLAQREEIGGDEAPAICIGFWGSHAADVGKVLGKRARAASLAKWTETKGSP